MKLIFLAAVLLAVQGNPLNDCNWGPSYWCQSRDIASMCGKVDFCTKNAWKQDTSDKITKTKDVSTVGIDECEICQDIAKFALEYVESNKTEAELETLVKQVCNYMGGFASECRTIVDDSFDEIWKLAENGLTADGICSAVKLCSSVRVVTTPTSVLVSTPQTLITCQICDFVSKLLVIITQSDSSKADIKTGLEKACRIPKPVETECTAFVNKNFDDLWDKIIDKTQSPQAVCAELFSTCPKPSSSLHKRGFVECEGCKIVLKIFLDKDKVQDRLDQLCKDLSIPADDQAKCTAILNDILNFTWNDFNIKDPKTVCQDLGLCSKSSSSILTTALALVNTAPQVITAPKVKQPRSELCPVCELVSGYLKTFVDSNTSESEVENSLDSFCNILPGNVSTQCDGLVKDYFPLMWTLLKSDVDADKVCQQIGVCNSTLGVKQITRQAKKRQVTKVGGLVECEACKVVIEYLDKLLETNSSEEAAEKELAKFCSIIPSSTIQQLCNETILSNFDTIWNLVVQETDPSVVCGAINLCSSSKIDLVKQYIAAKQVAVAKPQMKSVKNIVECEACKLVVGYLDNFLNENTTEAEALKEAEKFCAVLPGTYKDLCNTTIVQYFPEIWSLIQQELDSTSICTKIGLCTSAVSRRVNIAARKTTVTMPKVDVCDICNLVVNFVKTFVDRNSTETVIQTGLEGLCANIPTLKTECTQLVDDYFPTIYKMLQSNVDSGVVCQELRLCNSTRAKPIMKPKVKKPVGDTECDVCELVVKYIITFAESNSTEEEAEAALESFCNLLGPLSSTCSSLVDNYFPQIWQLLENELNATAICQSLGLCNSAASKTLRKMAPVKKQQLQQPKADLCHLCDLVVTFIKPYVDSNATQTEVENALESLCNALPSSVSSDCSGLVEGFFPTIWKLIENEVDSNTICETVGLCNSTKINGVVKVSKKHQIKLPKADGPLCQICELAVSFLKPYVDSNATENEVKESLKSVCGVLPGNYSAECNSFVDNNFDTLWEMVKSEVDNDLICTQLGLCTNSTAVLPQHSNRLQQLSGTRKVKGEVTCLLCDTIVKFIAERFLNNQTENETLTAVEGLCNALPSSYKDECVNIIESYFPQIWKIINDDANGEVCKLIGLCSSVTKPQKSLSVRKEQGGITCFICSYLISEIERLVNLSNVENLTIDTLEKVCDVIPSKYQDECQSLIETYGKEILDELINGGGAKVVCTVIGLCLGDTTVAVKADVCDDCKAIFGFIKVIMKTDPSIFEGLFSDFCDEMPTTIRGECADLIKEYGPAIVNLTADAINAESLCKDIDVCKVVKKKAPLRLSTIQLSTRFAHPRASNPVKDAECGGCIQMFEEMEVLLPKKRDQIVTAISGLCKKYLPSVEAGACEFLVSEFGDQIVDDIAVTISPRSDCVAIGVCSSSKKSPSLAKPWMSLKPAN